MSHPLATSGANLASTLSIASLAVALIAVIISLVSLYRSYLAPFRANTVVGDIRLRIYPIKNGEQSWYIASADIPVQVVNSGARIGRILQYRLHVSYPSVPLDGAYETFQAAFIVDYRTFSAAGSARFDWLKDAVISDWRPYSILPKTAVEQHIVFERRWDDPVVSEEVVFTLQQVADGRKGWVDVGSWELGLDHQAFANMARGSSYGAPPREYVPGGEFAQIEPDELHRLQKPKGPIPGPDPDDKGSRLSYLKRNRRDKKIGET